VKAPISKPLIFSFFLIGIILGLLLFDPRGFRLPQPETEQSTTPRETVAPAPRHAARDTASGTRQQDKTAAAVAEADGRAMLCDREEARAIRDKAREIAVFSERDDVLHVLLGEAWAYYSPGIRRSFVERIAAADTCLQGRGRNIRFFFKGEEVAGSDPYGSVELKQ
jgi:hypothetical protein